MSAWIVSKKHIDVIVSALEDCDRDKVGQMLWTENVKSIHYRYPDTAENDADYPGPIGFERDWVDNYVWIYLPTDDATLATQLACYEYQSCEHPEWETSDSRAIVSGLLDAVLARNGVTEFSDVPGAESAPWGV